MIVEAITSAFEKTLFSTVAGSFFINFLLAASLSQIFGMINVLQLIVFHNLITVEFPPNAMAMN